MLVDASSEHDGHHGAHARIFARDLRDDAAVGVRREAALPSAYA